MNPNTKFAELLKDIMNKRWYITAMVLGLFILITAGIFAAILFQVPMAAAWKELLMLLLGAFIGSYGKIIDYYYSDSDKDKMLVQKADEEDGVSLSHTNDMKETNKPVTPLIPDAFVAGAASARDLAVVENKQNFELAADQQEHSQKLESDKQDHEQEMAKLKLEHEMKAHRYCQHVWGDSDNDGELECQTCGLLKDSLDDTH
jgi:hypothetical protein